MKIRVISPIFLAGKGKADRLAVSGHRKTSKSLILY
jgi:hypothetical protein